MYLLNYKGLAHALAQDDLTTTQYKVYILFSLIIYFMFFVPIPTEKNASTPDVFITATLPSIILPIWLWLTCRNNERGDGKAFCYRLICLSVPIGIRTLLIGCLMAFVLGLIQGYLKTVGVSTELHDKIHLGGKGIMFVLMFIYFIRSSIIGIKIASGQME